MSRDKVMAAALARRLWASLDGYEEAEAEEAEALWVAEAARRLEEIRSGKVQTIPGDEAFRQVREAFGL